MPRHISSETYQMEQLRASPSQQHLDPSRSSSLSQPDDDSSHNDRRGSSEDRSHKLDLYSIPVFLLEVIVLIGIGFAAYYIHYEYKPDPFVSGFYCDDISLRHRFIETKYVQLLSREDNEIFVYTVLLVVPIVLIIFCELVNSLFGSLKFRQIRALCACCKLHSITRRTIRFSGAYALGFLIVLISSDILAGTSGHFRPYFAQECPNVYRECSFRPVAPTMVDRSGSGIVFSADQSADISPPRAMALTQADVPTGAIDASDTKPLSPPISSLSDTSTSIQSIPSQPSANDESSNSRQKRDDAANNDIKRLIERKWINLLGSDLKKDCDFSGDKVETHKFEHIAMSWPSVPAAIFTYACLFISCYLSFVGTARPFRIITCVSVMVLLLIATMFNSWLVRTHYHHWEDVTAGAALALVVVVFVVIVYLNLFRDTHYYEKQKVHKRRLTNQGSFKGYNNAIIEGPYNLDKTEVRNEDGPNGETGGSITNNDLAMRYFQIPRANYRGAPRPLASMNQMRS